MQKKISEKAIEKYQEGTHFQFHRLDSYSYISIFYETSVGKITLIVIKFHYCDDNLNIRKIHVYLSSLIEKSNYEIDCFFCSRYFQKINICHKTETEKSI